MRTLVNYLIHPMTWLFIGFLILWIRRNQWPKRRMRIGMFCLGLLFFVTNTSTLPRILHSYLEDQYPPIDLNALDRAKLHNIIVLGGGQGYDDRLPATSLLEQVSLARLVEAVRVYKNLPKARIITSGYSSIGRTPQAVVAKNAAVILGVPDTAVFAQGEPSNTIEEANVYVKRFGGDTPLIVVTSAIHIPRAVEIFQRLGVKKVYAAPTAYLVKKQNPVGVGHYIRINFNHMNQIGACLHEIVGLWYTRLNL